MVAKTDAIERLTRGLEVALGPNLVSLVLFGSAARDGHVPGRSDLNLMLVVREASVEALHGIAPLLGEWGKTGHPPPLIQTEAEWRESADVFPIEIEDMREAHRLLLGSDPFAGLTVSRADLRRELEREIRGKLLRLRTEYAAAAESGKALGRLLAGSAATFLVLLRAALRLVGRRPPADPSALVAEAAKACEFDAEAFEWALAERHGKRPPALAARDPVATRYLGAVERLAVWVDGVKVGADE